MSKKSTRLPGRVLKRYADVLLRYVYQSGGRERYIPVAEIEDALGLEQWRIVTLCRTRLRGEVHVSFRLPTELEQTTEFHSAVEREWHKVFFSRAHVRIRPGAVRLTEEELVVTARARKKKRKGR